MHHFALVTPEGDDLGTVEVARPDWPDGSVIYRGDGPNLLVIDRVEANERSTNTRCSWSRSPDRPGRGLDRALILDL